MEGKGDGRGGGKGGEGLIIYGGREGSVIGRMIGVKFMEEIKGFKNSGE